LPLYCLSIASLYCLSIASLLPLYCLSIASRLLIYCLSIDSPALSIVASLHRDRIHFLLWIIPACWHFVRKIFLRFTPQSPTGYVAFDQGDNLITTGPKRHCPTFAFSLLSLRRQDRTTHTPYTPHEPRLTRTHTHTHTTDRISCGFILKWMRSGLPPAD
jgi:hypothetical protein